jgi:hypothetical protein
MMSMRTYEDTDLACSGFREISRQEAVQLEYIALRAEGLSHNLAEMFALQAPPQIAGTDAIFLQGHDRGNQWEGQEYVGDMYKAEARAAGVDVTGKVYLGGLARYPGDPEAWVSGRGDVKRVCEQRGWGCTGAVKVKAAEPLGPPETVALADDIVDDKVAEIMGHVPEKERPHVDVHDLREQVKDTMTPNWNKE